MQIIEHPNRDTWASVLKRPMLNFKEIKAQVEPILEAVRIQGDEALRSFSLDFDNILIQDFKVREDELTGAKKSLEPALIQAIDLAYSNILKFHLTQITEPEVLETQEGVLCWRKSVAIQSVGIYIPGGSAPLFSTVLMLGIPAKIAGCEQIVLCSPSNHPAIYYAAGLCGIHEVYRVGGAQAIAAMAYGTESVPKVFKIFGPGNQYVMTAKQLVSEDTVAIDMPAGPSEVAVLIDEKANPAFVAADLLAQAEHGPDSQVILVSTNRKLINATLIEIEKQLAELPRKEIAIQSLSHSKAILVDTLATAMDLLNEYAPEHLILSVADPDALLEKVVNAGSVFVGYLTPESCGDYASGTNHALPTNGHAKAYSGVSLDSYVKKITFQKITKKGLQHLGPLIEILAEAEQLQAHKNAVTIRLKTFD